jgi:hypothetical protein
MAVSLLAASCGVERVTAVESPPAGTEAGSSPSFDAGSDAAFADGDAVLSESTDSGPPVEPSCTMAGAACTAAGSGCNVGMYYLYDNQFDCGGSTGNTCGPESAYGCINPDNTVAFVVTSNQAAGNTTVLAYSAMQRNFNNPPVSSFGSITATFEEACPRVGSHDESFSVWLDQQTVLVMVWVDAFNRTPLGTLVTQTTLGGRSYQVWSGNVGGQTQLTLVATRTFSWGTVDLLQILDFATAQGLVPAGATLGQIEFGVEIASTGGQSATFEFNDVSILTQ